MNLREDSISRRKSKRRTVTTIARIDSLEADRLLPRLISKRIRGQRDIGKITVHFIIAWRGLEKGGAR